MLPAPPKAEHRGLAESIELYECASVKKRSGPGEFAWYGPGNGRSPVLDGAASRSEDGVKVNTVASAKNARGPEALSSRGESKELSALVNHLEMAVR